MGVGAIFFTSNKVAMKRRERVNREIAKRESEQVFWRIYGNRIMYKEYMGKLE